jgi:exodeoxyribonuclease VII small subunit
MKKSFESSLTELEQIVRQLEDGDLSLEESLKLFESGVKLTRECRARLDEAERRIEILLKDSQGNPVLEPLETDDLRESSPGKRIIFDDDEDETF